MKPEGRAHTRRHERDLLQARLTEEGAHDLATILEHCGEELRLTCTHCGQKHLAEKGCSKRWCPVCAYQIAAARVEKYRAVAARFRWPLFLTLTIKNTPDPEGLKTIKSYWNRLRRRKLIREKVAGGIIGWEITNKGNGWHPHMHALIDCRWLSLHIPPPQKRDPANVIADKCRCAAQELERLWCEISGQDTASIRARRGNAEALVEVLKYSVKGSELLQCKEQVSPLIRLMLGMRLMSTFGSARKITPDTDPEDDEETQKGRPCPGCGEVGTMIPTDILTRISQQVYDSTHAIK